MCADQTLQKQLLYEYRRGDRVRKGERGRDRKEKREKEKEHRKGREKMYMNQTGGTRKSPLRGPEIAMRNCITEGRGIEKKQKE